MKTTPRFPEANNQQPEAYLIEKERNEFSLFALCHGIRLISPLNLWIKELSKGICEDMLESALSTDRLYKSSRRKGQ